MPILAFKGCFWPLTASMTSEVKNDYAYVITQDIGYRFIEVNVCVVCKSMIGTKNPLKPNKCGLCFLEAVKGYK